MSESIPLVTIYLHGDRLVPDDVSAIVNCVPTRSWQKGQRKRRDSKYIAKSGLWVLESSMDSASVDEQVVWLANCLQNRNVERLDTIPGVESAGLDVYVIARTIAPRDVSVKLGRESLLTICALGLELNYTVGVGGEGPRALECD